MNETRESAIAAARSPSAMTIRSLSTAFTLLILLFAGHESQAQAFRIYYQWFPGPPDIDTLRLSVQSTNGDTVDIDAVNFSLLLNKPCDSIISWNTAFTSLWSSLAIFERAQTLTINSTINGVTYNCRWQYGHQGSFFGSLVAYFHIPPNTQQPLQFAEFVFFHDDSCGNDFPFVEDSVRNPLNQWADLTGADTIYSYEVVPIVILPQYEVQARAYATGPGTSRVAWSVPDPSQVSRMRVYRLSDDKLLWEGTPAGIFDHAVEDAYSGNQAVYQVWLEHLDGTVIRSRKLEVNWAATEWAAVVFPTPAREQIAVRWPEGSPSPGKLQLLGADGKLVISRSLDSGVREETLMLPAVPPGSYILRWTGQRRFSKTITVVE